jgi:uncharacterized membrane protein YphA (DoxX/SURF4 family)
VTPVSSLDATPEVSPGSGAEAPARRAGPPAWQLALSTAARLGLAVVWLWAGIAKLRDLDESVRAVKEYDLFPDALAELIGTALPVLEISLGLLLLFGLLTRTAAVVSTVLLMLFIAGLAQAQARGLEIQCGCFGTSEEPGGVSKYSEILRDVGFLAMAGWLIVRPRTWFAADNLLRGSIEYPDDAGDLGQPHTDESSDPNR